MTAAESSIGQPMPRVGSPTPAVEPAGKLNRGYEVSGLHFSRANKTVKGAGVSTPGDGFGNYVFGQRFFPRPVLPVDRLSAALEIVYRTQKNFTPPPPWSGEKVNRGTSMSSRTK
jgi:hypothetical protein